MHVVDDHILLPGVEQIAERRAARRALREHAGPGTPGIPQGILRLPAQTHSAEASAAAHEVGAPGTVVLVFVFLAVFILYYFTNWKILSMIWKIG